MEMGVALITQQTMMQFYLQTISKNIAIIL